MQPLWIFRILKNLDDNRPLTLNNSGQATMEYILILTVVFLVGLGTFYQFHDAFGKYLDNYFGNYFACLLETGELPSIGGESVTLSECESLLQPFDINNGQSISTNSQSSGENSSNPPTSSDPSSSSNDNRNPRPRSQFLGGGNGNSEGTGNSQRPPSQSLGGTRSSGSSGVLRSQSTTGNLSPRTIRIDPQDFGGLFISQGSINRPASRTLASNPKAQELLALRAPTQKRKNIKYDPKKKADGDEEVDFSLGNILKWLLIIGLILAIIFFVGGQLLQLQKSLEKGE